MQQTALFVCFILLYCLSGTLGATGLVGVELTAIQKLCAEVGTVPPSNLSVTCSGAVNPCSWVVPGVTMTCDFLGHLVVMSWDAQNIAGTLPTFLGDLTWLTRFLITNSVDLHGTIPTEIGKMKLIQELSFKNNALSGELPTELGILTALNSLDLSQNALKGALPTQIAQLTPAYFRIADNQFEGAFPDTWINPQFEYFKIQNNLFSGTLPSSVFGPATANGDQYFDFSHNRFNGTIPTSVGTMSSIVALNFAENKLSGTIPQELFRAYFGFTPVSYMIFSKNFLSGEVPKEFSMWTFLKVLHLDSNEFTGGIPLQYTSFTELLSLRVNDNRLNGTVAPGLILPFFMDLSNNELTGDIPTFRGYPSATECGNCYPYQDDLNLFANFAHNNFTTCSFSLFSVYTQGPNSIGIAHFDISYNQIAGFPDTISSGNFPYTKTIKANNNKMGGIYPLTTFHPSLLTFDISNNFFEGPLTNLRFTCDDSIYPPTCHVRNVIVSNNRFTPGTWPINVINRWDSYGPFEHDLIMDVSPQDVDECTTGTHACPPFSVCTDGWNPRNSYTCTCDLGFNMNGTGFCVPICGDSMFVSGEVCDSGLFPAGCDSQLCTASPGWNCSQFSNTSQCDEICGDGLVVGNETCDTGTITTGNIALACLSCQLQPGWSCNATDCYDVDECLWRDSVGNDICGRRSPTNLSVCANSLGSYQCCPVGMFSAPSASDLRFQTCADVDECSLGLHNCSSIFDCANTPGGFTCCPSGYTGRFANGTSSTSCLDVDECSTGNFRCALASQCLNLDGNHTCCSGETVVENLTTTTCTPCYGNWFYDSVNQTEATTSYIIMVKQRLNLDITPSKLMYYASCFGSCSNAIRRVKRNLTVTSLSAIAACRYLGNLEVVEPCTYPCIDQTIYFTAEASMQILFQELIKENFIYNLIEALYQVSTVLSYGTASQRGKDPSSSLTGFKRQVIVRPTITFDIVNCSALATAPNGMTIEDVLLKIAQTIVPNAPNLKVTSSSCSYTISSTDGASQSLVGIIVGSILGALFLLSVLLLAWYFIRRTRSKSSIHLLPPDIAWSFKMCEKEGDWDFRGTNSLGYRFKSFNPTSKEFLRVQRLFEDQLLGFEPSSGSKLDIDEVIAIYNPVLVTNFTNSWLILKERSKQSPKIFFKDTWEGEAKTCVMKYYQSVVQRFSWNTDEIGLPILAACHGTDLTVAEKICETGFAALSSLDDGWYGKGIYFTCEGLYTLPYIKNRRIPAILISYVVPGHVYPVTEHRSDIGSLSGKPIANGYNSHFVGVNKNGSTWKEDDGNMYDEIVIPQEGQITPAFILKIKSNNFRQMFRIWKREIPKVENGMRNSMRASVTSALDTNLIVKIDS